MDSESLLLFFSNVSSTDKSQVITTKSATQGLGSTPKSLGGTRMMNMFAVLTRLWVTLEKRTFLEVFKILELYF